MPRKHKPDIRDREIIAWDGEGATAPDGRHIYTYLANSLGESIRAPGGLSTRQCFDFLLLTARDHPDALHVVYGMGYDANMILADVPAWAIKAIWTTGYVRWLEWGIYYRPNRQLTITRFASRKPGEGAKLGSASLVDAIGFSQSSFVLAVASWLGDDPRVPLIVEGKGKRGEFDPTDPDGFVEAYTAAELSALVDIERRMMQHLKRLEIGIERHDGAGSIAAALLKRHGAQHRIPDERLPRALQQAAAYAYFGGRIEMPRFGRAANVHTYDVRSAYPAAMVELPDYTQGSWRLEARERELLDVEQVQPHGLYRVRWTAPSDRLPFYPLPFREVTGGVKYPPDGEVWAWGPEVAVAAQRARLGELHVTILESWEFDADVDAEPEPWGWVRELYAQRRELAAAGDHAQIVLKLGLNSLYGKLAQRLGYNERTNRRPPYHSLLYAGWVTSRTRARLLELAYQAPDEVIYLATDGIGLASPVAAVEGSRLGEWEYQPLDELLAVQSGVYFARKPGSGEWQHRYRGWGAGVLSPELILDGWARGRESLPLQVRRFIGMGKALQTDWDHWRQWIVEERNLKLHPGSFGGKRRLARGYWLSADTRHHPTTGLLRTYANPALGDVSQPSRSPWDAELWGDLVEAARVAGEVEEL